MASSTSSSAEDPKYNLLKQAVYQKNGNIFFQTSVKSAIASEQKQADLAKAQLQKLNSA